MTEPPPDVLRLARERAEARRRRDFGVADQLRARIKQSGWEVIDGSQGFELRPVAPPGPAVEHLSGPGHPGPPVDRFGVSVLLDVEGWPADAARFLTSLARQPPPAGGLEVVAVDRSGDAGRSWTAGWDGPARVLVMGPGHGYGAARNAALWRAAGRLVVLVDTSLELTADLVGALVEALDDPGVAVAGPYGLASADLRRYDERTKGEVAAAQGYCLAARRADLLAVGGVRESFAFYRNADVDLSLRLRVLGPGVRRAVAVGADRCRRHVHRAWEALDAEERERESRRNMRRVLDRFGRRLDLAVP